MEFARGAVLGVLIVGIPAIVGLMVLQKREVRAYFLGGVICAGWVLYLISALFHD